MEMMDKFIKQLNNPVQKWANKAALPQRRKSMENARPDEESWTHKSELQ